MLANYPVCSGGGRPELVLAPIESPPSRDTLNCGARQRAVGLVRLSTKLATGARETWEDSEPHKTVVTDIQAYPLEAGGGLRIESPLINCRLSGDAVNRQAIS